MVRRLSRLLFKCLVVLRFRTFLSPSAIACSYSESNSSEFARIALDGGFTSSVRAPKLLFIFGGVAKLYIPSGSYFS